jgi:hypothetical protein
MLDARLQHELLRDLAREIMLAWNFPHHEAVTLLIRRIAEICLKGSLEPNAWLKPSTTEVFSSCPQGSSETLCTRYRNSRSRAARESI